MGRGSKKAQEPTAKEIDESPTQTVTQTRARRTPKPNPKYTNESVVIPPKIESEGSSDTEEKVGDEKVVKAATIKNAGETPASVKTGKPRGRPPAIKKQKLEYSEANDDEKGSKEGEKPTRSTRSKLSDSKDTLKVGEESVEIVDVSSIIAKSPELKKESPKNPRGRKRAVQEESPKESPKDEGNKKKKEEEKPSLITARKSYMPARKLENKDKPKDDEDDDNDIELIEEKKEETPLETPKAHVNKNRRVAGVIDESPKSELEKKLKSDEVKADEPKRLPIMRKSEITRASPAAIVKASPATYTPNKTIATLPTKIINNNTTGVKPIPRILNSMVTPKGKQSPNVKLAGDGTDKKVFSIDLTDDSIKEKKIIISPVKTSPIKATPVAAKENVAYNKPQPSLVLKNKLESELIRMKASANMMRRQIVTPTQVGTRKSLPHYVQQNAAPGGARRITKFESWYVIDVKNREPPPRHLHKHSVSLIKIGNAIKELQMPSSQWDYKVTLQRRLPRQETNSEEDEEEEVYTGDGTDKIEGDKANYEPSTVLFKRTHRENNKISIDRSLMMKQNIYTITMNGKQCKLIGAPDDIKTLEDLEILLNIIDSCTISHSCVELVTNHDIITIA